MTDGLADLGCSLTKNNPYVLFNTPPDSILSSMLWMMLLEFLLLV